MEPNTYDQCDPRDGDSSDLLRKVVGEICRAEPEEAAIERAVAQASAILDTRLQSSRNTYVETQRFPHQNRRRSIMRRAILLASTAAVLVCAWFGVSHFTAVGPGGAAFAQTVEQITKAKTITWTTLFYQHRSSKDGKRTWAHTDVMECAYRSPGLYREARLDENEQVTSVEITDLTKGRTLRYSPTSKKATLKEVNSSGDHEGPFAPFLRRLSAPNLQWIERRTTATGEVNVFRCAFRDYDNDRDWSYDYWIDAKTKQLVAAYAPGADIYDAEHDPARDTQPGKASSYHAMGLGRVDIRYDVALEDSLFGTEPPAGYVIEVKPRARVTEKETVDYIGLLADFNDKTFPDQLIPISPRLLSKFNQMLKKPLKERTAADRKLLDTDMRYIRRFGTSDPILMFFAWDPDSIVNGSFRYLGKGVKLGDKERIVCWYKLKDAKNPESYRVVYGDLSVKDVAAEDLPLPVEK